MYIGGTSGGITFTDTGTSFSGGGGTFTGPILLPDGSRTAPSVSFSEDAVQGFYRSGTTTVYADASADIWWTGVSTIVMRNNGTYGFSSGTTVGSSPDVILGRDAAATLQLGADAATATDQTIKGPDSTGAGQPGAILNIKGGDATSGNANGGQLALRGGAKVGTGEPGAVSIIDTGTKPTCDSARRGSIWYDQGGAGVADTFEVCAKQAAGDTYAWRALATIP
jgi:hypothetical protein